MTTVAPGVRAVTQPRLQQVNHSRILLEHCSAHPFIISAAHYITERAEHLHQPDICSKLLQVQLLPSALAALSNFLALCGFFSSFPAWTIWHSSSFSAQPPVNPPSFSLRLWFLFFLHYLNIALGKNNSSAPPQPCDDRIYVNPQQAPASHPWCAQSTDMPEERSSGCDQQIYVNGNRPGLCICVTRVGLMYVSSR